MINKHVNDELLFVTMTPLGFYVRVTHNYWKFITSVKHPVMAGCKRKVKETLTNPEEIRRSKTDPNVYLFYRSEDKTRWICAVAKQLGREGFLITTYPTDSIKEGEHIWPK